MFTPETKNPGDETVMVMPSFIFPETSALKAEHFDCDKLVHISIPASDQSHEIPDYAFFKLKTPHGRPPLKVSRAGVTDNQVLTIRKVNFHRDGGDVVKATCKAVQNSVYMALFSNDLSPVIALGACPLIKGNSGAPILDSAGEIRGILSALYMTSMNVNDEKKEIVRGLGANAACINLGFTGVGYGIAKQCVNVTSKNDARRTLRCTDGKSQSVGEWPFGGSDERRIRPSSGADQELARL